MKLHEYQAKSLFAQYGIPVPKGKTALTPQEVYNFASELNAPVIIKAQVLSNQRVQIGMIQVAQTPEIARDHAANLLGARMNGQVVGRVLVESLVTSVSEIYLSITYDRERRKPVLLVSETGGSTVEQTAQDRPAAIIREEINPFLGVLDYQARELASSINLPYEHWEAFTKIAQSLYDCFASSDALFAEINPLILNDENVFYAVDGRMTIDDNALYRQPELRRMQNPAAESAVEKQAHQAGINFHQLQGQVACIVNGAGLAMTVMDLIMLYGSPDVRPANFLDMGEDISLKKVVSAFDIALADSGIRSMLVNIFGGITPCDEIANTLLEVIGSRQITVPIVVRFAGIHAEEGQAIIENGQVSNLWSEPSLTAAVKRSIEGARGISNGDSGQ